MKNETAIEEKVEEEEEEIEDVAMRGRGGGPKRTFN